MATSPSKPPDNNEDKESIYSFEYSDGDNFEELLKPPVDRVYPFSSSSSSSSSFPNPAQPSTVPTLSIPSLPSFSLGTLSPRRTYDHLPSSSSSSSSSSTTEAIPGNNLPSNSAANDSIVNHSSTYISSSAWICTICTYSDNTIEDEVCAMCGISSKVSVDIANNDTTNIWICSTCCRTEHTKGDDGAKCICTTCGTRNKQYQRKNKEKHTSYRTNQSRNDHTNEKKNTKRFTPSESSSFTPPTTLGTVTTTLKKKQIPVQNNDDDLYAPWITMIVEQCTSVPSLFTTTTTTITPVTIKKEQPYYTCTICSTTVRNERFLRAHIWKKHQSSNPQPIPVLDSSVHDNISITSSLSSTSSFPNNKRKRLRKVATKQPPNHYQSTTTRPSLRIRSRRHRRRRSDDDSITRSSSLSDNSLSYLTEDDLSEDITESVHTSSEEESESTNTSSSSYSLTQSSHYRSKKHNHHQSHRKYARHGSSSYSDDSQDEESYRYVSRNPKRSRPALKSNDSFSGGTTKPTTQFLSETEIQRIRAARLDQLLLQTTTIMNKLTSLVQHQQNQTKLEREIELARQKEALTKETSGEGTLVNKIQHTSDPSSENNDPSSSSINTDISTTDHILFHPTNTMNNLHSSSKVSLSTNIEMTTEERVLSTETQAMLVTSSSSSSSSSFSSLPPPTSLSSLSSLYPSFSTLPSSLSANVSSQGLASIRPSQLSSLSVTPSGTESSNTLPSTSSSSTLPSQPSILTHVTMRDYQIEGLRWLVSLHDHDLNGILADEMGLGKTLQILAFIAYLAEHRSVYGPYLIVVPLSVLGNWKADALKFSPDLATRIHLHHGLPDDRFPSLSTFFSRVRNRNKIRTPRNGTAVNNTSTGNNASTASVSNDSRLGDLTIVVTTYDLALRDRKLLQRTKWQYLIVDEGHRLKNSQSKLSRTLQTLRVPRRLLLTGTPLQNNLQELWSLLNFCLPKLFNSSDNFSEWFAAPFENTLVYPTDTTKSSSTSPPESLAPSLALSKEEEAIIISRLHDVLRPFLLRRMKTDVLSVTELPVKKETILWCPMSAFQAALYERTRLGIRELIDHQTGKVTKNISLNNLFMRLRQICNHPYLLQDTYYSDYDLIRSCGKFQLLANLLPKLCVSQHRILIFSQMTSVLDLLEDLLDLLSIPFLRLDGSTNPSEREERMGLFSAKDSHYPVFLLSTRAGGLGVNLATADTVIIYDSDWNPQADLQAQARAHRLGQTKEVHVYRLISRGPPVEQVPPTNPQHPHHHYGSSIDVSKRSPKPKNKELATTRLPTLRSIYRRSVEEIINLRAANKLRTEATVIGAGKFHHQSSTVPDEDTNTLKKNINNLSQLANETLFTCLNDDIDELNGDEDDEGNEEENIATEGIEPNNEEDANSTVTSHTENGSESTNITTSSTKISVYRGKNKESNTKIGKKTKYAPMIRTPYPSTQSTVELPLTTRYSAVSNKYINRLCSRDSTDTLTFHQWDNYCSALVSSTADGMDIEGNGTVDRIYYVTNEDYRVFNDTKKIHNDHKHYRSKVSGKEENIPSNPSMVALVPQHSSNVPKVSSSTLTTTPSRPSQHNNTSSSSFSGLSPSSSLLSLSSPNKQSLPTRRQLNASHSSFPLVALSYTAFSSSVPSVVISVPSSPSSSDRKKPPPKEKTRMMINNEMHTHSSFPSIISPASNPSSSSSLLSMENKTNWNPSSSFSTRSTLGTVTVPTTTLSIEREKLNFLHHYRLMQPEELSSELRQYCIVIMKPNDSTGVDPSIPGQSSPLLHGTVTIGSSSSGGVSNDKRNKQRTVENSTPRSTPPGTVLVPSNGTKGKERQRRQTVHKGSLNETSLYRAALASSRSSA